MNSSPPPSSSSSSPPPPPPCLLLQRPELQAEFLRECQNKFQSRSDVSECTTRTSSSSSSSSLPVSPSPVSPSSNSRQARLSLSSPELLSELEESKSRPLRHVPAHKGLTTVFSGRGGQACGPTQTANQRTSH